MNWHSFFVLQKMQKKKQTSNCKLKRTMTFLLKIVDAAHVLSGSFPGIQNPYIQNRIKYIEVNVTLNKA